MIRTTTLRHWHDRLGSLVEWSPTTVAPVDAAAHPVPPSFIQERHLRRLHADSLAPDRPAQPWTAFTFTIAGPLDEAALTSAFEAFLARHDTLASWFTVGTTITRHMVDTPISLDVTARRTFTARGELTSHLCREVSRVTSPMSFPGFYLAALSEADHFTVVYAVDHTYSDGFSLTLAFAEITALYEARLCHVPAALEVAGSYLAYAQAERDRLARLTLTSPPVQAWLAFLGTLGGGLPEFALPLGSDSDPEVGEGTFFADLLSGPEVGDFASAGKAAGGTFSSGMIAALALTDRTLVGRQRYLGFQALSTRDDDHTHTQGWFINAVPLQFDVADAPFGELVRRAHAAQDSSRQLAPVSVQAVLELLNPQPAFDAPAPPAPPMVSYLDMRRMPGAHQQDSAELALLVPDDMPAPHQVSMWLNRCYAPHPDRAGESIEVVKVMAVHPRNALAAASVARYFECLRKVLLRVTVSDQEAICT